MYKLLAIDIDGTLISFKRPDISDRVKEAVRKAKEMSTHVVLISGRNYKSMNRFLEDLNITEYGITTNGSVIVDVTNENILYEIMIDESVARGIIEILDIENIAYTAFSGLYAYAHKKHEENRTVQVLKREKDNVRIYDDIEHLFDGIQINKFSVIGKNEDDLDKLIDQIKDKYGDIVEVEYGLKAHIDIYPKGTNKGIALTKLAEKLQIPMEQVIAIGDSENDISMIEAAGLGIAMGNAFEHVKECADYITQTIEEDGAAQAIEKFILC